jgi:hypothetical protein
LFLLNIAVDLVNQFLGCAKIVLESSQRLGQILLALWELLIILVMMGMFLVVPLALIVAAYLFGKRRGRAEVSESGDS